MSFAVSGFRYRLLNAIILNVWCWCLGGFLAGLMIPKENGYAISLVERFEDLVGLLFLPQVCLNSVPRSFGSVLKKLVNPVFRTFGFEDQPWTFEHWPYLGLHHPPLRRRFLRKVFVLFYLGQSFGFQLTRVWRRRNLDGLQRVSFCVTRPKFPLYSECHSYCHYSWTVSSNSSSSTSASKRTSSTPESSPCSCYTRWYSRSSQRR